MWFGLFDPMYLIVLAPAMILAAWAQWRVKSAYASASRIANRTGLSGAETAAEILSSAGVNDVAIRPTRGFLSDHYDPRRKVLRLSPDVYQGCSLAAVGIAAHEAGHALQHHRGYAPLALRNGLVPMASAGGTFSMIIFFLGMLMGSVNLVAAAIVLFSAVVLFQLINLPVEFNASSRARAELLRLGLVGPGQLKPIGRVLNAAALTYVAATLSAILTLLYFLLRSGLLGGIRDE
ncbi:MAG: zinc metallopeptidase [Phycisphaerae bacterium]